MTAKSCKIALISDIHGNLAALEAVIADIRKRKITKIWNLGDAAGYGRFPNEVLRKLREVKAVSVIGNYDIKVLDFKKHEKKWRKKKSPEKYYAFEWNWKNITEENKTYLGSMPQQRRITEGGLRILLRHGGPAAVDEYIDENTTDARFETLARLAKSDIAAFGHTHRPFAKKKFGVWFINPGSVGRPENPQKNAEYAVLEIRGGKLSIRQLCIDYDRKESADIIQTTENNSGNNGAYSAKKEKYLQGVVDFARQYGYDGEHSEQVTKLALQIFDELEPFHNIGKRGRFLLHCGAVLHDIGLVREERAHHKASMKIIMTDKKLQLKKKDKIIVGLLARYHRRSGPKPGDKYFSDLSKTDKRTVEVLAGILRVADGLDYSHRNIVDKVFCRITKSQIHLGCQVNGSASWELASAGKKSDLMEAVFKRKLLISIVK